MGKLIDKLIIFICCLVFYLSIGINPYSIVPIAFALTISSFISLFDESYTTIIFYLFFLTLCYFFPETLYFTPLLCYDLCCESYMSVSFVALPIIYLKWSELNLTVVINLLIVTFLVILLKSRYKALTDARKDLYNMRDHFIESSEKLNIKNRDLLERQEYEINNATLNERNRIAREIHDTVGHLLSSSILQIGALLAITKDEATRESLTNIKDTLSTGMDSIRASIHNLHEDSLDLELKINGIIHDFDFCPITFNYNVSTELPVKAKYSVIFIVKESLANVMKHSNATHVSITLNELPGLYQLVIKDNGTNQKINRKSTGMGTTNIRERINELGGNLTINTNHGYRLFITIPKREIERK